MVYGRRQKIASRRCSFRWREKPRAASPYESDLAEDVGGVPGPHEVGGVRGQSQHSLALDLLLQRLLVLPLQNVTGGETVIARGTIKKNNFRGFKECRECNGGRAAEPGGMSEKEG